VSILTRPDLVRSQLEAFRADDAPDLSWCDLYISIRLSGGDTDWFLVRAVWSVAIDLWSAITFADGSGFDVSIDDLPSE
jgi:hypothetical protein